MKAKLIVSLAVVSLALGGCAQVGKLVQDRIDPLGSAKEDCIGMGLVSDTPEYRQCVQNLYAGKQNSNAAAIASQGSMMSQMQSQPVPIVRPTMTTCNRVGSSTVCSSM